MTAADGASYASWGARAAAYLLDLLWVVPGAILYGAGIYTVRQGIAQPAMRLLILQLGLSFMFAGWGYTRWYLGGRTGASWGKTRMGLVAVAQDGQPIPLLTAVLRDLAHVLDAIPLGLGFLLPLWDRRGGTFADRLLHTSVLRTQT